jgi:hypothetical protein
MDVLVLGPAGPDAELEPAAGQVVDGRRHLRQHARVPVGVAGDRAADAHPLGQRRHAGQRGPGLEDVQRVVAAEAGEVVHVPAVVEARLIGDPPHFLERVDRGGLADFDSETKSAHKAFLSHPADDFARAERADP